VLLPAKEGEMSLTQDISPVTHQVFLINPGESKAEVAMVLTAVSDASFTDAVKMVCKTSNPQNVLSTTNADVANMACDLLVKAGAQAEVKQLSYEETDSQLIHRHPFDVDIKRRALDMYEKMRVEPVSRIEGVTTDRVPRTSIADWVKQKRIRERIRHWLFHIPSSR